MANEDSAPTVVSHEQDEPAMIAATASGEPAREEEEPSEANQIKVSSNRNAYFYVDLATRFLRDMDDVELSGLGYGTSGFVSTNLWKEC